MSRKDKIVSAVGAALAAGAIGGGVAVANAQPTPVPPPPPAPTVVAPEVEDSAECAGGVDTDNIPGGRPERPGGAGRLRAPCTARTLRMLL